MALHATDTMYVHVNMHAQCVHACKNPMAGYSLSNTRLSKLFLISPSWHLLFVLNRLRAQGALACKATKFKRCAPQSAVHALLPYVPCACKSERVTSRTPNDSESVSPSGKKRPQVNSSSIPSAPWVLVCLCT